MSAAEAEYRVRHQTFWFAACLAVLIIQIAAEYMMGRVPICACGYVKLWEGGVNTSGNSQHLSDWYTPSHIIHGFLFYGLAHLILRGKPLAARLLLALVIESGWELLENSPLIIDRYRTATIALDYYGDSILNSAMDTVFMTKLIDSDSHSTRRRLAIFAVMLRPSTLTVTLSPILRPSSWA